MSVLPAQKNDFYTVEEFFAWCEQHPNEKFELVNGEIIAMAGASRNHNRIAGKFYNQLSSHLKDTKCEAFISDIFVECRTDIENKLYLPDVVVDCSENESDSQKATSPILIIEVLSKSTREKDLFEKSNDYQKIPSLQEYVLVEQYCKRIFIFSKNRNWNVVSYTSGEIYLESVGLSISFDEIYDGVIFLKVSGS